jgi:hypothetical protein
MQPVTTIPPSASFIPTRANTADARTDEVIGVLSEIRDAVDALRHSGKLETETYAELSELLYVAADAVWGLRSELP